MTTENVAILFTDIVGSTQLSHHLPPDAANQVRRMHFSILRQAIAEANGAEVKTLGDGLMVVFGSASAAMACAVAMQQGVERDNRGREHPVGLRVALSCGEVTREDDDYFGEPVVEAARLCATCQNGQILAADIVRLIAGRYNRQRCNPLGELLLKGLPDRVETVEVLWEPSGEPSNGKGLVPLPGRLVRGPLAGVIGREVEMQALTDSMKRVAAGEGRELMLVSGEAGLGKTTLVAEAGRAAFGSGAHVLFGHCEEGLATPYQLFAEALGHLITHVSEDQLVAHAEVHGSELVRLVPALATRIAGLPPSRAADADSERFLLLAAVVGLLATVSERQPVVIVLDDLQWADKGSLLLLRHLAAAEQDMRVLILGTYRDSELSRSHPLVETLAALHRQSSVYRIELAGLDDNGVVALLEAIAGYALDDAAVNIAHAVYRETDGNPFFVNEILRHLSETGAIFQDLTGRWVARDIANRLPLPESVREVVGARVGRLGEKAEKVLSLAAVIGRDFDFDLLERASARTEEELLDILDASAAAGLVREMATPGDYNFTHALIQHTLYEDLGPTRRARAHRAAAQALEDLCGDRPGARVGELARHWSSASQPIDLNKAIGYSRQAADAALSALAPGDAVQYYEGALDLYAQIDEPDPALGIDLEIGLGTAQRQTGDPAFRDTLLTAARRAVDVGDTGRLIAAALANDRGFYSAIGATDAEKVEILETAAHRLSSKSSERALVLATLCSELAHGSPLDRRQALADEAVAIAESLGDDAVVVRVLNHLHVALQVPSLLESSLNRTADALIRAERIGDPVQMFWAAQWRAEASARAGDIDEMNRCIAINGSIAEQLDQPLFTWDHTFVSSLPAQIAGDTDRAEQLATTALEIGTNCGQPDAAIIFGAQLMIVSGQRGTMSELAPLIEEMATKTPDISRWLFGSLLAKAHVEGDRTEDARRILEKFAAADFDLPLDQTWLTGMVDFADAAIECGDQKYAGPLFDRLAPWASQLPATGGSALGPVSHYLGGLATVLGRYDEADAYLAQSAAMCERMGATFFAARTDLSWGRLLAARKASGDAERARALLMKAHAVAKANGYGTVERRTSAALHGLG